MSENDCDCCDYNYEEVVRNSGEITITMELEISGTNENPTSVPPKPLPPPPVCQNISMVGRYCSQKTFGKGRFVEGGCYSEAITVDD